MARKAVVVLGAGASHDSATRWQTDRPPLVKDLFSSSPVDLEIIRQYALAETAGPEIRAAAASAVGLEQTLRDRYRDSPHDHDRRVFHQVPLYLQHRLAAASSGFVPDHYNQLIMTALRLDDVVFVTLNYDLVLDQRLDAQFPLRSMGSYLAEGHNWALIKLHGSVNWARRFHAGDRLPVPDPPYWARTFDHFALRARPSRGIELRHVQPGTPGSLDNARVEGNFLFFPALSVPLGPDDELSCPPHHLSYLEEKLGADGVHALFIGYSGYDVEVMRLLREQTSGFKSVTIVNPDPEAPGRILEKLGTFPSARTEIIPDGFGAFVAQHLDRVVAQLD